VGLLDDRTSPLKGRYAVSNGSVVQLSQPGAFQDQLTDVLPVVRAISWRGRADHHLALGQMAVADDAGSSIVGF
jgi:hypothetical protein